MGKFHTISLQQLCAMAHFAQRTATKIRGERSLRFRQPIATPVRIEITTLLKRIELRVSDVNRAAVDAVSPSAPVAAHRLAHLFLALPVIAYRLGVSAYGRSLSITDISRR